MIILFTSYNQFKNCAAWLTKSISTHNSRTECSQMWYFRGHLASNVNFNSEPNPEKVMTGFFKNYFKNLFWSTLIVHLRENSNFRNTFLPFFFNFGWVSLCKISEKTNERCLRNAGFRCTDARANRQAWIINRTNLGRILHLEL